MIVVAHPRNGTALVFSGPMDIVHTLEVLKMMVREKRRVCILDMKFEDKRDLDAKLRWMHTLKTSLAPDSRRGRKSKRKAGRRS